MGGLLKPAVKSIPELRKREITKAWGNQKYPQIMNYQGRNVLANGVVLS